jgi:hypothetical protein
MARINGNTMQQAFKVLKQPDREEERRLLTYADVC